MNFIREVLPNQILAADPLPPVALGRRPGYSSRHWESKPAPAAKVRGGSA